MTQPTDHDTQNKRRLGSDYEKRCALFLREQGIRVLTLNYRCRRGEIDLISRQGSVLIFTEVKYRSNPASGLASEAVDRRKQERISRVADEFWRRNRMDPRLQGIRVWRFDVCAIQGEDMNYISNAFPYIPPRQSTRL